MQPLCICRCLVHKKEMASRILHEDRAWQPVDHGPKHRQLPYRGFTVPPPNSRPGAKTIYQSARGSRQADENGKSNPVNIVLAPGGKPEHKLRKELPSHCRDKTGETELSKSFHRNPDWQRKQGRIAFSLWQGQNDEIPVPGTRVPNIPTDTQLTRYPQCVQICLPVYICCNPQSKNTG